MAGTATLSDREFSGRKGVNLADGTSAQDAATKAQVDAAAAYGASLANRGSTTTDHTAISDFDTQVRTSRLDQMAAPTNPVAFGSQRATGVADPSSAQDAATKSYVDTQLAGTTAGLALKGTVRAAVMVDVDISTPGSTLDGLTAATGEVFLLAGQSTGSQGGPYVFNGSSSAMTRAANWDSSGEALLGSFWIVREGTKADQFAILSNDSAITLGTTTPAWVFITIGSSGSITGFTATCASTSAGGTWTVTHNLNTKILLAAVARVGSPYDFVDVRIERTTVNTLSVKPDVALSTAEFEAIVILPITS